MKVNLSSGGGKGMVCPVCVGTGTAVVRQAYDDRYGQPTLFTLVRCVHCSHTMTSPRLVESDLGALYSTYYPRKHVDIENLRHEANRVTAPLARFWRWCAGTDNQGQYSVKPGERMLDIGCGSGLSLLEAQALGAEAWGVEADPNVRRIADDLSLRIHIGSLLDEPFAGEKFDLVVLNQVIEHVPDPGMLLDRLRSRIRTGGRIVLVFPNAGSLWCRVSGERWINWHVPYHLHHFSRDGFVRLAMRCGYRVRSMRSITPNLWTILQMRASRLRVRLGEPSPMWVVSALPAETVEAQTAMTTAIRRWTLRRLARRGVLAGLMLPISLVNRIVDGTGWGDSLMVEIVPAESG